jgi:MFS family permease
VDRKILLNKKVWLIVIGKSLPMFFTAVYSFACLLIFYRITNSLILSSVFTTISIVISRIAMFIIIPFCKVVTPRKMVITGLLGLVTSSLLGIFTYSLGHDKVWYYGILLILFSVFQEILDSYVRPLIPVMFDREDIFKINSFLGVIMNLILLASPFVGALLSTNHLVMLFSGIAISSFLCIRIFSLEIFLQPIQGIHPTNRKHFIQEWRKTYQLIKTNSQIIFCLMIAIIMNLIFVGMTTSGVLAIGNNTEEIAVIRTMMGLGSFIGILFVMKVNMKENYHKFLNVSIIGIFFSLIICYFGSASITIMAVGIFFLVGFIMFTMNSTGTLLQLIVPQEEIASVYEVRSSILAIVVPLSHVLTGLILELTSVSLYFTSILIIVAILMGIRILYIYKDQTVNNTQDRHKVM